MHAVDDFKVDFSTAKDTAEAFKSAATTMDQDQEPLNFLVAEVGF